MSHLALLRGDPRALHRRILQLPEFQAWAADPPPEWLGHVQLDAMEAEYGQYRPAAASWRVHKMLPLELPYIREGQYAILIVQNWSNMGWYPYEGEIRFRQHGESCPYEGVTSPGKVRETVRWLQGLSPKIKVALYSNPASITAHYAGQWDGDIADLHPDWLAYDRDGRPRTGERGCYLPNLRNEELRRALLDQYAHMADYYGADLLYLDYGGLDNISWGRAGTPEAGRAHSLVVRMAIRSRVSSPPR